MSGKKKYDKKHARQIKVFIKDVLTKDSSVTNLELAQLLNQAGLKNAQGAEFSAKDANNFRYRNMGLRKFKMKVVSKKTKPVLSYENPTDPRNDKLELATIILSSSIKKDQQRKLLEEILCK